MQIHERFVKQISESESLLRRIPEDEGGQPYRSGSWTRTQLLGHLIDSAVNNHNRFVRASLDNEYHGPGYDQEGWVRRHRYESLPWTTVVDWWATVNQLLLRVVREIPQEQYAVPCFIDEKPMMSLEALMEDYLRHLQHHVEQLVSARAETA